MNVVHYIIYFIVFLFVIYYINNTLLGTYQNGSNVPTPGYLIRGENLDTSNSMQDPNKLLSDLHDDISKRNQTSQTGGNPYGYSAAEIPASTCCLPGSPGASQYNYGGNQQSCGPVTVFDPDGLAKSDNFRHSTPEVINSRMQNWIPQHMISQLHYVGPFEPVQVEAANQNEVESTCYFKSEKTNLAQYFKANPDLYLATDKFSTFKPFVPFTDKWKEDSDCYNNSMYQTDKSIPGNFVVNKVL